MGFFSPQKTACLITFRDCSCFYFAICGWNTEEMGKCLSFVCFFLRGQKFGFVVRRCCVRCKQPLLYICFELEQHEHEVRCSQPWAQPPTRILVYLFFFSTRFLGSLSARSYLPEHKKPGMKKFSLCVPKTFDFCFFTLGP